MGLLYEGKLVIDKTWGHGYYGCAGCCGHRYLNYDPNPYTDLVGNGSWNTLWSYDVCGAFWDDVTAGGYNWASDNTGVATVASAYTSMVGVGSANGSALVDVNYQQRVKPGQDCPVVTVGGQAPINAQPRIDSIDPTSAMIGSNNIQITINGAGFGTNPPSICQLELLSHLRSRPMLGL